MGTSKQQTEIHMQIGSNKEGGESFDTPMPC